MADLVKLEARIKALDLKISPIANQTVDIASIMKLEKDKNATDPLSRAKVTPEAEALLEDLIEAYKYCGESDRGCIRLMLANNASFDWATGKPPAVSDPTEKFRRQLLRLSMSDQGRDPRDLIWSLDNWQREAKKEGIDLAPIATEIAALSSDEDRYGMGSTKQIFTDATDRWKNQK